MTTFKTIFVAATVVALGAAGPGPSSALARVFVSPQSNARGNVSGPVPAPTFRQLWVVARSHLAADRSGRLYLPASRVCA